MSGTCRFLALLALLAASQALAADDLTSVQSAFLQGEYGSVLDRTKELLDRADSGSREELLYLQGVSALKLDDQELAQASLQRLVSEYPDGRWTVQGRMALAETYAAGHDYPKALAIYTQLIQEEQAKGVAPAAHLRLGELQRNLGLWKESKASLETVVQQAPATPEAQRARGMLEMEEFYFSVQVGAFGTKANALSLKKELERRGYVSMISEASMRGSSLYRVRVGQFASRMEAEKQEQRLQAEGFPTRIVP